MARIETFRYQVRMLKTADERELQRLLDEMGAQGYRYRDLVPMAGSTLASGMTTHLIAVFEQPIPSAGEGSVPPVPR